MACLTSAIEPLRAANEIIGHKAFSWKLVSENGGAVASSAEVVFDTNATLADVEGIDSLYILSSPDSRFAVENRANGQIRWLARHGMTLGGFSGGVFPLARSGALLGHKCSVHWCYEAAFKAEFPDIVATDRVITIDRKRATASGAGAVFDLMLRLIDTELGPEVTTEVACWFQHPFVRGEDIVQKIPAIRSASTNDMLPPAISRAIKMFDEHIEDPIQISDVADAVCLSARQLERRFKQTTGKNPLQYYRMLRMMKARQMVWYSNDSLTEIARAVGYASSSPMIQHYVQAFEITPREDRKRINIFRVEA
mgnify:FL=1